MNNLSVDQQIDLALSYEHTNLSAVAREMGTSQQNLYKKITRNTLKKEDICKIAEILGGEYVSYFSFLCNVKIGGGKSRG
jgi:hypothetical protein